MPDPIIQEIAKSFMVGDANKLVDIITFIEAPWGFNFKPKPTQAVILKCFYGLPLDDTRRNIEVPDMLNSKILYRFTEKEFISFLFDEGRINTKDMDGKDFRELVVVAGRRGGKCRYEKDIIATTEGSLTFRELLERNNQNKKIGILTYDQQTLKRKITYDYSIWDNGVKSCLEVVTKRGIREISSTNHPYLIWRDDWKYPQFVELGDILIGDSIAVSQKTLFGKKSIGINKAKLLGYLQGDGGTTHSVVFTTASDKILKEFKSVISKEFSDYIVKKKGKASHRLSWEVTKKSGRKKQNGSQKNAVKDWLSDIGCFGKKAVEKEVPKCILEGSKGEVASFLSRLFACDGWASVDKKVMKQHKVPSGEIGYCSSSPDLIQGVRHLLLKFGIQSVVRERMVTCDKKKFKTFSLSVCSRDSIFKFINEIGIFSKEDALAKLKNVVSKRVKGKSQFRSIPVGIWKYVEEVQKERGLSNADVYGFHGKIQKERLRKQYAPSRDKVSRYGINIADDFVYSMGTSDVYWDKVKSIKDVGEKNTIDLEVAETHIIGGDILSHNSTIASCISGYEMYKLIKRSDPSKFYGFPPETQICVMNVAPTDEQAGILYDMTLSFSMNCPYLRDRTVNQTQTYFNLQTDADRQLSGKRKRASIVGITGGCASNSLRGRNNIVVIMDEFAFFIDNGGRFSGSEVYKALTPSTATFKGDGKVICISSPYAKYGAFWERYNQSFSEEDTTLMFRMYSAMMNPEVDPTLLKVEHRRDRTKFMCEYGGEFSDSITSWLDDEERTKVRVQDRHTPARGQTHVPYFMGIDLGLKNDGTAVAIVHRDDKTRKIILDYADVWYSGSSDVWDFPKGIYKNCTKFSSYNLISIEEVSVEIQELCKWYPIKSGWFDQWNGYSLHEDLFNKGLKQFHMEQVTDAINNRIYQLVKMLIMDGLVEIYKHPILLKELFSLEAERKSKNKTSVHAPNMRGAHDDLSDAFARAVYEAYTQYKEKGKNITSLVGRGGIIATSKDARGASHKAFMMNRNKIHGQNPRYLGKKKIIKRAIRMAR